jgi:ABC-type phosphate transport system substrate-binding protein
VALALSLSAFFASGRARALDCADLPPPIIYGLGGSATKPLLGKVASGLAAATSPSSIVYQAPGACVGINGLIANTLITGTASYWDTDGKEQSCTLPVAGQAIDFANMGNSAPSCPGVGALPADIGDFVGPVNTYNLIVPTASSQTAISSEGAYFAFGFGQLGQAQPWVDDTQIFKRDANSAAQLFISLATGIPAEKFKGVDTKSNAGTITAVAQSLKPEAAIGLVSGEVADANRATVRTLAYQHKGQRCGFTPDSTVTSFDKKNVRNGLYHIWAPIHFFARIDAAKKITNPEVAKFLGYFTGDVQAPANVDILSLEIKSGNVPRCAMNVWRETDLGALTKNVPDKPCGCFFESVATGGTTCASCADSMTCPKSAPVCRRNFCEAR